MAGTDDYIREACDTLIQLSADEKNRWNTKHMRKRSGIINLRCRVRRMPGFEKENRPVFRKASSPAFRRANRVVLKKQNLYFS